MSELPVYNIEKVKVGTVDFPKGFGERVAKALLHQTVVAQMTNRRQGNAKVKNRKEVTGSTRKIYRQKGTGGARHGDIKAPLFIGGGRAFGPKPKEYDIRMPQKMRKGALKAAILQRKNEERLWVLEGLEFKEPKTKIAAKIFEKLGIPGALVVVEGNQVAVEKSIRNLEGFAACRLEALNLVSILRYDHLVMTPGSYKKMVEALGEKL